MFQASTAHHQEVRCKYVANGTSKMTDTEPGSLSVILPPDDWLLMTETCTGVTIM
jgi:hypothetical protein